MVTNATKPATALASSTEPVITEQVVTKPKRGRSKKTTENKPE